MTFHITIAQELRTGMTTGLDGEPVRDRPQAMGIGDQLHVTDCETRLSVEPGDKGIDLANANVLRVVEWDLHSPWIVIHKGADVVSSCMPAGWPTMAKEEYDAQVSAAL